MGLTGVLFLIVGPSGSGKGTVISELKKRHRDFVYPVSCTTRAPRPGEVDGEVYSFVSKERFVQWREEGKFLEWAEVHQDHYYGVLKEPVVRALAAGKVVVREMDIQGFKTVLTVLPRESVVAIFLEVNDLADLKKRILQRGRLPDEEIARRMESARVEIAQADLCNYRIPSIHGEIERMVGDVEAIMAYELQKRGLAF